MDQINEIKSKLDIVEFITTYVPLKKTGNNFKGICPFHTENTPSFIVSPDRQIWHCFGCGEGGDIYRFLMKYENIEFPEALKILAQKAGITLERTYDDAAHSKKDTLLAVNLLAAEFFHYILLHDEVGKNAREYLKTRNVSDESVKLFKLGYAPKSWDVLGKFLQRKGYKLPDITETGLVISKKTGRGFYDRFRGRLMFPVFTPFGSVAGFSGRILTNIKDEPKYVNSSESVVFNKGQLLFGLNFARDEIKKKNETILVEGNLDVISSHQVGVRNVVAPLGSALTFDQVRTLKRYGDQLALCFDADFAGEQATKRGIEIAEQSGMSIKIILVPNAKDPDELIQKDVEAWKTAVTKTIPAYDFLLNLIVKRNSADTAYGRKKIGEEGIKLLATITDKLTQAYYIRRLAQRLDITEDSVVAAIAKEHIQSSPTPKTAREVLTMKSNFRERRKLLEEYILSLALKLGVFMPLDKESLEELEFQDPETEELWKSYLKEDVLRFNIQTFCDTLSPQLVRRADELYLKDWGGEEEALEKEFISAVKEARKLQLQEDLKRLSQQIAHAEQVGNEQEQGALSEQFNRASQLLANLQVE